MNCPTCNTLLAARWDTRLVCPVCDATGFSTGERFEPGRYAIATVQRLEATATSRGWTLGELWNVDGCIAARGIVCFVQGPRTTTVRKPKPLTVRTEGDRITACSETRIAILRASAVGDGTVMAFYRSSVAAAVPADRLTVRNAAATTTPIPHESAALPAGVHGSGQGIPEAGPAVAEPSQGKFGSAEDRS